MRLEVDAHVGEDSNRLGGLKQVLDGAKGGTRGGWTWCVGQGVGGRGVWDKGWVDQDCNNARDEVSGKKTIAYRPEDSERLLEDSYL